MKMGNLPRNVEHVGTARSGKSTRLVLFNDADQHLSRTITPAPCRSNRVAEGLVYRDFLTVGLLLRKCVPRAWQTACRSIPEYWVIFRNLNSCACGRVQDLNNWKARVHAVDSRRKHQQTSERAVINAAIKLSSCASNSTLAGPMCVSYARGTARTTESASSRGTMKGGAQRRNQENVL